MTRHFRLRVSRRLADDLDNALEQDGYGRRQKGIWVGEALDRMRQKDPTLIKVGVGDALDAPFDRSLGLTLRREHFRILVELCIRFRECDLLAEGVRAIIVRSAIRSRLRDSRGGA